MKYLVPCPACGRKTPVATGQAGQILQCTCGQEFEVPSIRKLRDLEPVAEEPVAPLWTKRQGLLFLGGLITLCSVAFAGVIWLYRPALFVPPAISFDQSAVEKEVQEMSPAEAYRRLILIQPQLRTSFEERMHSKSVPPFLLISAQPLIDFEGRGPGPLAPTQMGIVRKEINKYTAQMIANASVRQSLVQWLWVAGAIAVGGILIAGSAFLFRSGASSGRPQRAPKRA